MYAATTKDEGNAQMGVFHQPPNACFFITPSSVNEWLP
jgi:hypothetical protein